MPYRLDPVTRLHHDGSSPSAMTHVLRAVVAPSGEPVAYFVTDAHAEAFCATMNAVVQKAGTAPSWPAPSPEDASTVAELIAMLQTYPAATKVMLFLDWDRIHALTNVADQGDGTIVLGSDLPPEMYTTDYVYED